MQKCEYFNYVALHSNRVRVTMKVLWVTGEGAPDFRPIEVAPLRASTSEILNLASINIFF